jgi:hypothetical protein
VSDCEADAGADGADDHYLEAGAQQVRYVLSNSREIKVGAILLGLALITFVWFVSSLAARLRDAGEPRLAAIAFGGAVATAVFAIAIAV